MQKYNIEELQAMDAERLQSLAENLGVKKPKNTDTQTLVFDILDQQAKVVAEAGAAAGLGDKKHRGRTKR